MCFQCCVIVIVCTSESECVKVCLCGGEKKNPGRYFWIFLLHSCLSIKGGGHRERREGGEARHVVVAWGGGGCMGVLIYSNEQGRITRGGGKREKV